MKLCGLYETEHCRIERLVNHIRYHMVPVPYYPAVPTLELFHVPACRGIVAVRTYGKDRLYEIGEHTWAQTVVDVESGERLNLRGMVDHENWIALLRPATELLADRLHILRLHSPVIDKKGEVVKDQYLCVHPDHHPPYQRQELVRIIETVSDHA